MRRRERVWEGLRRGERKTRGKDGERGKGKAGFIPHHTKSLIGRRGGGVDSTHAFGRSVKDRLYVSE